MNLFNRKTIARHIVKAPEPSADQLATLKAWGEMISSGRILSQNEKNLQGQFNAEIVQGVLGYTPPTAGENYTVSQEQTIIRGSVDLALGFFGGERPKIIAPFELKGANTKDLDAIMPGRAKSPVQQAWEYATQNPGTKWVLVSNYLEIRLYGFGEGTQSFETFDLKTLHEPENAKRLLLLLSADQLLSGRTQALLEESRKEDKDITDALYDDYKALRLDLISAINTQGALEPPNALSAAQTILDRVLFIAFAEDTGLLPKNTLLNAYEHSDPYNPKPIWQTFQSLFNAIDQGSEALKIPRYNGGLFAPDEEVNQVELSDETCEGFKRLGTYDFASEISVTVLGHIFEQSITDMERLQAQARGEEVEEKKASGTSGRRKRDGVVYTPDYVARFIVEQTIGTHLSELFKSCLEEFTKKSFVYDNQADQDIEWKSQKSEAAFWKAYREKISALRIVDPACGSGVFLVTAFDYLKAELERVNTRLADLGEADLFDPDSEILTHNLYGVDVNSESVEITKLSLWIKTAKPGKVLDDLDHNILVGDSLIEDSNYAYLDHPFTWKEAFPKIFKEGGFDIVLGNPPYVRNERISALKPYLKRRFEVYDSGADLLVYFFERALRILKDGGRLGYISSTSFFKTDFGTKLRDLLRTKFSIELIIDFGDNQIFEGVVTYPIILTGQLGVPSYEQNVRCWYIDELPSHNFRSSFNSYATLFPQSALDSFSWNFEDIEQFKLKQKMTNKRPTLKEVYGSPLYGIKTGRNEAFVIDRKTRDTLIAQDPKSVEVLKPWLEGKDLSRWGYDSRDLYLILLPKGWTVSRFGVNREEIQWKKLCEAYPPISNYLSKFEENCRKRSDKGDYWWELRACDYYDIFDEPRIIYPETSQGRKFSITENYFIPNKTIFSIPVDDYFLLSLLNSTSIWFYLGQIANALRGGEWRLMLQSIYIETIPIPFASDAHKKELGALARSAQSHALERLRLQENFRHRIPDLAPNPSDAKLNTKLKEWWEFEDFQAFRKEIKKVFKEDIPLAERNEWEAWFNESRAEIHRLTGKIKTTEDKINEIVYDLFELTLDEIELLEGSI